MSLGNHATWLKRVSDFQTHATPTTEAASKSIRGSVLLVKEPGCLLKGQVSLSENQELFVRVSGGFGPRRLLQGPSGVRWLGQFSRFVIHLEGLWDIHFETFGGLWSSHRLQNGWHLGEGTIFADL